MKVKVIILFGFLFSLSSSFNPNVHAFFYLWYGNPEADGKYVHWNHSLLPHWTEAVNNQHGGIKHFKNHRFDVEAGEIHSPYTPYRGLYSSRNLSTVRDQLKEMYSHGIGVAVLSYIPSHSSGDSQRITTDELVGQIIEMASSESAMNVSSNANVIKIALHLEPYENRTIDSIYNDIVAIKTNYFKYPSLFRINHYPVMYFYDSYHISTSDWRTLFARLKQAKISIYAIGLLFQPSDISSLSESGFQGMYSYFPVDQYTFGSTTSQWEEIRREAEAKGLEFFPSIGPGYQDDRIRPWNKLQTRHRDNGNYYVNYWNKVLSLGTRYVSITSFNEFGEGTQIEACHAMGTLPRELKAVELYAYPNQYLDLTFQGSVALKRGEKQIQNPLDTSTNTEL
jgi:glycoprotein endo-alpha-1,2-mannosidase